MPTLKVLTGTLYPGPRIQQPGEIWDHHAVLQAGSGGAVRAPCAHTSIPTWHRRSSGNILLWQGIHIFIFGHFPGIKWELWKAKEMDFDPKLSMKLEKLCWDQSNEGLAPTGKRVAQPLPALIKTFPYLTRSGRIGKHIPTFLQLPRNKEHPHPPPNPIPPLHPGGSGSRKHWKRQKILPAMEKVPKNPEWFLFSL